MASAEGAVEAEVRGPERAGPPGPRRRRRRRRRAGPAVEASARRGRDAAGGRHPPVRQRSAPPATTNHVQRRAAAPAPATTATVAAPVPGRPTPAPDGATSTNAPRAAAATTARVAGTSALRDQRTAARGGTRREPAAGAPASDGIPARSAGAAAGSSSTAKGRPRSRGRCPPLSRHRSPQDGQRADQDGQVHGERPVVDVVHVEGDGLLHQLRRPLTCHRPVMPADPQAPPGVALELLGVHRRRAGADQRHVASQHVPQLWQLVERRPPEEPATRVTRGSSRILNSRPSVRSGSPADQSWASRR